METRTSAIRRRRAATVVGLFGYLFVTMLLFPPTGLAQTSTTLPPEIKGYLDKRLPGWSIARIPTKELACREAKSSFSASIVSGDFDGDQKRDHVVQVTQQHRTMVIAFLSNGAVQMLSNERSDSGYPITVVPKGVKYFDFGRQEDRTFPADIVKLVICGRGNYAYYFSQGKFHTIQSTE